MYGRRAVTGESTRLGRVSVRLVSWNRESLKVKHDEARKRIRYML